MSGHSKWSQIKRQKGAADVKRGQVFSKLSKAITLAAKEGGSQDPSVNYKLRMVIETAKTYNMPKENIARAVEAGARISGGVSLEEVTYEGFAPAGVAVLVDVVTDNKNRTLSEIKKVFERGGGTLSGAGSVAWNFEKKGQITVKFNGKTPDEILTIAADSGADDVEILTTVAQIYSTPEKLTQVKEKLIKAGLKIETAELTMKPKTVVKVGDSGKARQILSLVDTLDNLEDVQKVYSNFDIPDEILAKIESNNP